MSTARYWHKHPGGFTNICHIIRTTTPQDSDEAERQGYQRITRREARQHIAWLNTENDAWSSNRAVGRYSFRALTDPTHPDHDDYRVSREEN